MGEQEAVNSPRHMPVKKELNLRTFLVVQWLKLYAPKAGGLGSIPGQGIKFHTPQLKVCMPQLKEKEKRSQAQSEGPVVK